MTADDRATVPEVHHTTVGSLRDALDGLPDEQPVSVEIGKRRRKFRVVGFLSVHTQSRGIGDALIRVETARQRRERIRREETQP